MSSRGGGATSKMNLTKPNIIFFCRYFVFKVLNNRHVVSAQLLYSYIQPQDVIQFYKILQLKKVQSS